jgi:hypothetical protein
MANEFINHATNTIKEVAKTMQERGSQYADTWGEDGCWHLTKAVVAKLTDKQLDARELKAIALASFCDQKYSRFAGGYKKDTAIDLIPYLSALVDTLNE